jgi:predicted transcriptional regulator of viral defense system
VVVPKSKGKKLIGRFHYQSVALGRRAVGSTYLKGYRVSSRAKTFFDCFLMPKYAGGISRILPALVTAKLTDEEWKEWLGHVERIGTKSLAQRAGHILSEAKRNGTISVPKFIIDALSRMSKKGIITVLDPSKPRNGRFVKEWNLYDNIG